MNIEDLVIPLNGLAPGKHHFGKKLGKEFFAEFDEDAVLDASADVSIDIVKSGTSSLAVTCSVHGELGVPCDRCLERVAFPIDFDRKFTVKFSAGESQAREEEDVMILPENEGNLDMKQYVYDYSMLCLPLRRVHDEGGCDAEMVRILEESREPESKAESPFAVLKGLYGDENEI